MVCNGQKNKFTSFDGTKIAYEDVGEGDAIVLVHGFINSGSMWNKSVLKRELLDKGYRLIVPDLRGNGSSEKPQTDKGYANNAEVKDLKFLADRLGLKSYAAIGYSRGSIVLAKLLTIDDRVKKAVFGGMGIDFTNPNWDRRLMFAEAFAGNTNNETKGAVTYAKSIGADLQSLHLQQKHQPVTSIEELERITIPVLVISGDEDVDNGSPVALKEIMPKGILKRVKGDHNATYKKDTFSKAIVEFLE